ncbi:MAG: response regulator transcription factor [Acidimicrobiales bacterium]|nr:response regulator transcription factor [Acidimicrobiales bacterium]
MRVLVVEDAVLLRAGLVRLLGEAGHQVAELGDAERVPELVERERPDLVLLDVRLPPSFTTEGLRAAREIRDRAPGVAVLVLSQYVEAGEAVHLVAGDQGGLGYLLKDRVADVAEFLEAVDTVGAGGTVIDPEVVRQLVAGARRRDPLARLTPREREVLDLMAQGCSNAAIARRLVVSDGAVEKHISSILAKLGITGGEDVHRRVQAVLTYLDAHP